MIAKLSEIKVHPQGEQCINCGRLYSPSATAIVTYADGKLIWWHSRIEGGCSKKSVIVEGDAIQEIEGQGLARS